LRFTVLPVVFANTNQPASASIDDRVGVTHSVVGALGANPLGLGIGGGPVELLVCEIRKINHPVMDDVISAPVFMDSRAGIEFGRSYV
jgi:hypothetical protein